MRCVLLLARGIDPAALEASLVRDGLDIKVLTPQNEVTHESPQITCPRRENDILVIDPSYCVDMARLMVKILMEECFTGPIVFLYKPETFRLRAPYWHTTTERPLSRVLSDVLSGQKAPT